MINYNYGNLLALVNSYATAVTFRAPAMNRRAYVWRERQTARVFCTLAIVERWGAGVETQKKVLRVFGGWGRVPFNEPYAPSLSIIYDGA